MNRIDLWDIPSWWEWKTIGDLGDVVSGGTPPSKEPTYWGGEINWISPADLTGYTKKKISKGSKSLTKKGLEKSSAKLMPKGSVHFSSRAPIGYVAISEEGMSTNQGFKSLVPKEGVFNEYVYYYLKGSKQLAEKHASGTTFMELSGKAFRGLPIPLPPENEQKEIVTKIETLFSELDKGIESLLTARQQLKAYRQAVLKHAFEGKLTEQWRQQNPDKLESPEQLLSRIQQEREQRYQHQLEEWKQAVKAWGDNGKGGKKPSRPNKLPVATLLPAAELEELASLPFGWCWMKVGVLSDVVRGGSPRPAGDSRYYNGDIPFLKVADLTRTDGCYVTNHTYTIKPAGLQKTRSIDPDTLLISNSGATLGVPKICLIKATFNDGIAAFLGLIKEELLYHYYFWSSKTYELRAINQGAAQPNLNTDLIKNIAIPICLNEEKAEVAKQIEKSLSITSHFLTEIGEALEKSESLRRAILKKAFSGQLVYGGI